MSSRLDLEKEYRRKHAGGSLGNDGALVKRSDIFMFARQQADLYAGRLLDFSCWDWLLRCIQAREVRLADTWSSVSNQPFDLEKVARHQRLMWCPETVTERDIFILAVGSRDKNNNHHHNHVFDESVGQILDHELVAGIMFNPKYRGLDIFQSLELWNELAAETEEVDGNPDHPLEIPQPMLAPASVSYTHLTLPTIYSV